MKKKRKNRAANTAWFVILAIAAAVIVSFMTVRAIGKARLKSGRENVLSEIQQIQTNDRLTNKEKESWQEGWVKYDDRIYAYNEDILSFLFMGIDKDSEVAEAAEGADGGQADALFLLIMNPHDKSLRVLGINRNTMTEVDLYDGNGSYITTVEAQIAVQHGFGNGLEESCEYQVNAVRKLLYNIPVHGYCAVNMDAVTELTDMIGGIELTAIEDVRSAIQDESLGSYVIDEGETALLDGRDAYSYVRYRDADAIGSADKRLERQKQFLSAFIVKTKEAAKRDITLPVKLYNAVTAQMVTDVTLDEMTYLASSAINYSFDREHFYSVEGENVQGEIFEEYYVDEQALYELILELFYEPVENR